MDPSIIAAIIGAIATIIAAALSMWHRSKDKPIVKRAKDRPTVSYPKIQNPDCLNRDEVNQLLEFYGMFRRWRTNPHLTFQEGDVSYWYEQGLSEEDLRREFEARRGVLERAETSGEIIETQGDLSFRAQRVQAQRLGSGNARGH